MEVLGSNDQQEAELQQKATNGESASTGGSPEVPRCKDYVLVAWLIRFTIQTLTPKNPDRASARATTDDRERVKEQSRDY